jgi:flagellin-specific chaperone FliS
MIVENEGYWIENNAVYRGEFYEDGIDQETVVKLDTMTMSDVELKKLIFIIEQLTKGLDSEDNGKWNEKL